MLTGPRGCGFGLGVLLVMFGLVKFVLVWSIHIQRKKLNNYLILINLICEFVC